MPGGRRAAASPGTKGMWVFQQAGGQAGSQEHRNELLGGTRLGRATCQETGTTGKAHAAQGEPGDRTWIPRQWLVPRAGEEVHPGSNRPPFPSGVRPWGRALAGPGAGTAAAHTGWSPGAAVGRECRQRCRQLPARQREAREALDPCHEAPARCRWSLGFAPGDTLVPSLLRWPDPAHQQPGLGAAPGRRYGRIGPGAICSARSGW